MTYFEDICQRVRLLNGQLDALDRPGSDLRLTVQRQLWKIVDELNDRLGLGLTNTALDLKSEDGCLRLAFWESGADHADCKVSINIEGAWKVTKYVIAVADYPADVNSALGPSTADVTNARRDTQRRRALDDPSQGL
jgi:hypothetical protein